MGLDERMMDGCEHGGDKGKLELAGRQRSRRTDRSVIENNHLGNNDVCPEA